MAYGILRFLTDYPLPSHGPLMPEKSMWKPAMNWDSSMTRTETEAAKWEVPFAPNSLTILPKQLHGLQMYHQIQTNTNRMKRCPFRQITHKQLDQMSSLYKHENNSTDPKKCFSANDLN